MAYCHKDFVFRVLAYLDVLFICFYTHPFLLLIHGFDALHSSKCNICFNSLIEKYHKLPFTTANYVNIEK